jgi:rsbT co-antagonist protein RsbR
MSTPADADAVAALQARIATLETELAAYQQRTAAFFDQALALLCTANFSGYFVQLNPIWEETLGFTRDELCAEPFLNFVHPDDREATIAAAQQLGVEGRNVIAFENRYRCKDGSYRVFRWHSYPDMERQLIYAAVYDLTTEREAAAQLKASEERYRSIALNIPGAIYQFAVRDGVWMIDYMSERIFEIAGVTAAAVMDDINVFINCFHPEDRLPFNLSVLRAIDTMTPWHFEGRLLRPDGTIRWWQGDSSPMRDTAGNVLFNGVLMDITERQLIMEAQRENERQAEIIRAQQAALEELSTPLIPINDRVMVMPLIGAVDSRRAQQVLETLLTGIAETRAEVAILDITGVSVVDTQVANALIRAAQAVKLLGAQVILTGIKPEIAQTLVGLGTDLGNVVTRSTLQSGIALAMQKVR